MDLALAIHQINPAAAYRLADDKQSILEWRGPGAEPTQAKLDAAWTALQAAHAESEQAAQQAAQQRQDAIDALLQSPLMQQHGLADAFKVILGL